VVPTEDAVDKDQQDQIRAAGSTGAYLHAERLTRFNARTVRLLRISGMLREADATSG
jgi:hypothetical protein